METSASFEARSAPLPYPTVSSASTGLCGGIGHLVSYRNRRHWEPIIAADFFTVKVWTRRGLQRFLVLFFLELATRKVEIAGIASTATGLWMSQVGRNLTDSNEGILNRKRYLIHDRDPLFTREFLELVASAGRNR